MSRIHYTTPLNLPPSPVKIGFGNSILSLGSCFSTNLASKLQALQWPVLNNPFGTTYNPLSIASNLNRLFQLQTAKEEELVLHQEVYSHFGFHSDYSSVDAQEALQRINTSIKEASSFLTSTKVLCITFGTAFAYFHSGNVVNNCHKLPQKDFERRLLNMEEMMKAWHLLLEMIKDKTIIFSLSPVRHLRDNAVENSLSKSMLRCFIHELTESFDNILYFPAFEYMMDELRDYRFYDTDLVHPNNEAVDYILSQFMENYFDEKSNQYFSDVMPVLKDLAHRPRHLTSSHEKFKISLDKKIHELKKKYPEIDFNFYF